MQLSESDSYQYRIVNAEGAPSPSMSFNDLDEAKEAAVARYERYPEDGPQKIQQRRISAWEDR